MSRLGYSTYDFRPAVGTTAIHNISIAELFDLWLGPKGLHLSPHIPIWTELWKGSQGDTETIAYLWPCFPKSTAKLTLEAAPLLWACLGA